MAPADLPGAGGKRASWTAILSRRAREHGEPQESDPQRSHGLPEENNPETFPTGWPRESCRERRFTAKDSPRTEAPIAVGAVRVHLTANKANRSNGDDRPKMPPRAATTGAKVQECLRPPQKQNRFLPSLTTSPHPQIHPHPRSGPAHHPTQSPGKPPLRLFEKIKAGNITY